MQNDIKLFEQKKIRSVYDEEKDIWYFSVVDVISILIEKDYQTARKYWKVLKGRLLKEGGTQPVTNCYQLKMMAPDGKMRETDAATAETMIRIISSFHLIPPQNMLHTTFIILYLASLFAYLKRIIILVLTITFK